MPIYFHGISIHSVRITQNKKRPWKFWQNAKLNGGNGCVRRVYPVILLYVEKNNRAILLGQKCCVHLNAWVSISAKGELPYHSTTTFVSFHYLITHTCTTFFLDLYGISLCLSLSLSKEWIWQCQSCFMYWLLCFASKIILSLFIRSQRCPYKRNWFEVNTS